MCVCVCVCLRFNFYVCFVCILVHMCVCVCVCVCVCTGTCVLEGCGFTGFQVFTGLRCSRFEKPVRSKKKPKNRFLQGT